AGQTAPGGGILLKSYAFWILDTHDIVVRCIRIRPGFMGIPDPRGNGGRHGILIYGYKSNAHDIIFDHVSVSWQTDDNSIWGNVYNVTIQWSIFAEGAKPRDEHDCGGCGLMWGPVDKVNQLTVHHNLLMNNFYRSPKAGGGRNQLYNNVIYNPGWSATHMVGGATGGFSNINSYPAYLDIIGNYYKKGPSTRTGVKEIRFELPYEDSHVRDIHLFLKDNFGWNYNVNDPFAIVANRNYNKHYEPLTEQAVIPVTIQSASFAKDLVIRNAGANLPERDAVDSRLIYEFNTNTGNTDVGSDWPFIANGTAPKDSDHDGMPDTWELANGFNPNSPADGNQDADGDGYTNVEEYLNEIATTDGIIAQINVDHDSGFAPLTVQFTGSGSGGTPPYNYLWEFGASSTANTQSLQHTFQNAGSYTVKLTVTDNENRSGFSYRLITVKEATSTAKTNLELKVTEVDQSAEVFSVIPEKWYDLYIQFKGSQGLEHVKYADVWVSHETYQEGNIDNRGGIHSPENNYVMSYSIANSTIWARQKEGDLVWENVTGKLGRYIDDDNHEYQQDSHNKWARARFKLLDKVRDGNWVLNAYFVDEFGQKSELFKKKIQVVS
ncbi:MAG: PKD domain-containing protein, partial [Calditrichia bacterium]